MGWNQSRETAEETVFPAFVEKFRQHPQLIKGLLDTGTRTLGEASPSGFWGTGVALGKKDTLNSRMWSGHNVMGEMLTRMRDLFCDDGK